MVGAVWWWLWRVRGGDVILLWVAGFGAFGGFWISDRALRAAKWVLGRLNGS